MKEIINSLKGDKVIWSFVALLALFSFMPVFSASSNLAYIGDGTGNTIGYLLKHLALVFIGFIIIYWVHKVPYNYYKGISKIALPIVWILLVYTLVSVKEGEVVNASRWIELPFIGVTFQTSTIASIVLMLYVARYLSKKREIEHTFKESLIQLWLPVFVTLMLILPANFSTAALLFSMVLMLTFVGKYSLKYIGFIIGTGIAVLALFYLLSKAFPNSHLFSRVNTWSNRIENYTTNKPGEDDNQIEKAKIAIASGGIYGLGPGKSVQKNFLPQSASDFIYAIIVEEWGLLGGFGVLFLYLLLFFRFLVAAHKAISLFGKLLIVGLGFSMIFQAMINMAVAVELLPVTGQTLPLISSGGSSIWMTCIAVGIIINVTKKEEEIAEEIKDKAKRESALQKLIDKQLEEDDSTPNPLEGMSFGEEIEENNKNFSIQDKTDNPMTAIKGMRFSDKRIEK